MISVHSPASYPSDSHLHIPHQHYSPSTSLWILSEAVASVTLQQAPASPFCASWGCSAQTSLGSWSRQPHGLPAKGTPVETESTACAPGRKLILTCQSPHFKGVFGNRAPRSWFVVKTNIYRALGRVEMSLVACLWKTLGTYLAIKASCKYGQRGPAGERE